MPATSLVRGSDLLGPFQNLGDGTLLYPCNGSNLQLGAPYTGQPDSHLRYCRYNMTRHVMVLCSPEWNLFEVSFFCFLFFNLPQIKPSMLERKAFTMLFVAKWGHIPLKREGKGFVSNNEHVEGVINGCRANHSTQLATSVCQVCFNGVNFNSLRLFFFFFGGEGGSRSIFWNMGSQKSGR